MLLGLFWWQYFASLVMNVCGKLWKFYFLVGKKENY
jgi:hypothetical protein